MGEKEYTRVTLKGIITPKQVLTGTIKSGISASDYATKTDIISIFDGGRTKNEKINHVRKLDNIFTRKP